MAIDTTIIEMAKKARKASAEMARCPSDKKNDALLKIADKIEIDVPSLDIFLMLAVEYE